MDEERGGKRKGHLRSARGLHSPTDYCMHELRLLNTHLNDTGLIIMTECTFLMLEKIRICSMI